MKEELLFGYDDFEFEDEDSLLDKGVIDSVGIMELVFFVQNNFDIDIKDEEIIPDNFDSINKLSSYISRKMNKSVR